MFRIPTPLAASLALALGACQPFGPGSETVSGTLTFRERVALPPEAVAVVSLVDVSGADAGDALLGRTEIVGPGNPPIPFAVRYLPAAVKPERPYGLNAHITVRDELRFTTDRPYPVLTGGAPRQVEVLLVRPGAGP